MEIKTKRLLLKPLGVQYLNSTFQYASDFDTTKFMVYLPSETLEETLNFYKKSSKNGTKTNPLFMNLPFSLMRNISVPYRYI